MYPTLTGFGTRTEIVPSSRLHASVGTPARGQLLTLKTDNLYYLAANTSSANANLSGVIVGVKSAVGGAVESVSIVYCGDEVPLRLFGTLAQIQALGTSHTAYLSATPGVIIGAQEIGVWVRRVFRMPKVFSSLTEEEYQRLYVLLIEEIPNQS